jgi:hypothetical protein
MPALVMLADPGLRGQGFGAEQQLDRLLASFGLRFQFVPIVDHALTPTVAW